MNNLLSKVKTQLNGKLYVIFLAIPFIMMDLATRILGFKIDFFPAYYFVPNAFTITWLILFIGIITSLKGIWGKITYWILFGLFFILFLTNNIYYALTSIFFGFNLLEMSDEGSTYILDAIIHTNPVIYILAIIILITAIWASKKIKTSNIFHWKRIITTFIIFLVLHTIAPLFLGSANSTLTWNTFKKPRNVYNDFNDCNRSMKLAGLYEYSFRNFYMTYLKPNDKISSDEKDFLDSIYSASGNKSNNEYTGIFKGKNVIFLQLEGIDSWMFNKNDTPNLYSLLEHSINFTDHYSLYTGGGSTFNSEFAVNTGFTTPLSYVENVYSFNKNYFPHSMARIFKEKNYSVNAFHMNSGDFYSRSVNYKSWGYDNYWGLSDIGTYENGEHELDRELILNKTFYKNMFQLQKPFVDYIITYSPHTPFSATKGVGKLIAEEKYKGQDIDLSQLTEEECARLQAGETDYMAGLLIQALKDNNLYDNTVIVAYADHYLYTLQDKSILNKYKTTGNNLINHTPFFMWSSNLKPTTINKTNMQTDILPTVLNLFGMDYNSNNYIGHDILDESFSGYVFFPDYSWYNGNVYVENNEITNNGKMSTTNLFEMNKTINDLIKKNDLTLKYDYFRTIDKKD